MKRSLISILFLVCALFTWADLPIGVDSVSVCNRDLPYMWHGKEYPMIGTYYDTIQTAKGDSVCVLVLSVQFRQIEITNAEIASGETYYWRGNPYSQPGIYLDTIEEVPPCGRIYQLVLKNKSTADSLVHCMTDIPESPIFDYTNLNPQIVHCYYGTRVNPFEIEGKGYHTYFEPNSKEVDPLTKMSVVPAPDVPSMRLGAYMMGAGRAYAMDVDYTPTDSSALLKIYFANVMQTAPSWHIGGNHRQTVLPVYFSIFILDENGDTIPNSNLTKYETASNFWSSYTGSYLRFNETLPWYHPWDNYIVNLSNYVGQHLTIRAITTECSTHSCCSELYVAFTPAELKATCCDLCGVLISAPKGKRYEWHKGSPTGPIVSTMDAACVEADSTMYYCNLYDDLIGSSLTLHQIAFAELPVAKISYDIDLCNSIVTFSDSSFLSYDGSNPISPRKHPAYCEWDFGNGQTYVGHTPPMQTYEPNKTYQITLISRNNNVCEDTAILSLFVPEQPPHYEYTRYDTICASEYIQIGDSLHNKIGEYTDSLKTAIYGCDSIVHLVLRHWPSYIPSAITDIGAEHLNPTGQDTPTGIIRPGEQWKDPLAPEYITYDTICRGDEYWWHNKVFTSGGTYYDTLYTIHGCDSIFELQLYAYPSYIHTPIGPIEAVHLSAVPQETPPGIIRPGEQWKDPIASDYMYHDTICKGDTLEWHGKKLYEQKVYVDSLKTIHGCDSLFYMDLHLDSCSCDTAYSHTYANIKERELPTFQWNGILMNRIPHNNHQDTTLVAPLMKADQSCDSIATLHLHVLFPCELPTETKNVRWKK